MRAYRSGVGIGDHSTVVAYDDNGDIASRRWWLLRYLGHDAVFVLDGGFKAWVGAGGRVDADGVHPEPRSFTPHPDASLLVVDRAEVERAAREHALIDSRAGARYRGDVEPVGKKAGHIPGELNRDWQKAFRDGHLRPDDEIRARFLGIPEVPLVYCESGGDRLRQHLGPAKSRFSTPTICGKLERLDLVSGSSDSNRSRASRPGGR